MRSGRLSLRLVVVAAALSIAATSCGGGGRDVEAWTTDVCGSLGSWFRSIQTGGESLEQELEDVSPGDVRSAQEGLVRFLDGVIEDTGGLLDEIEDAGVPAVEDGDRLVETFEEGFGRIRDDFEDALERIEEVPPDDAEGFVNAAEGVERSLDESGEQIQTFFDEASSEGVGGGELEEEFDRNESCAELEEFEA